MLINILLEFGSVIVYYLYKLALITLYKILYIWVCVSYIYWHIAVYMSLRN